MNTPYKINIELEKENRKLKARIARLERQVRAMIGGRKLIAA